MQKYMADLRRELEKRGLDKAAHNATKRDLVSRLHNAAMPNEESP